MDFQLADHGRVFSTRPRGLEIRKELKSQLSPAEQVSISFESVAKVSQSFSDEFLCELVSELGLDRVHVVSSMEPSVERVLSRALRRRGYSDLLAVAV